MLNELESAALACLREASADEWTDAYAVTRKLSERTRRQMVPSAVGRVLSRLADQGWCERRPAGGSWSYRTPLRAVKVYDEGGVLAGRLLLWHTPSGLELDLSQLQELLPTTDWKVRLESRDARTIRAAADEVLWRVDR